MSTPTPVRVSFRVTGGGRLLTRANLHRIRALSQKVNKSMVGPGTLPDYKDEYRLIYHPKQGYAWIEVYYGSGMRGWHKSIREAVIGAAQLGIPVVVDPEPVPARPAGAYFDAAARAKINPGRNWPDWFEGAEITFPRRAAA